MLKVAFDIVEVLRFLKAKRNILHRNISAENVMYVPPSEGEQDADTSIQDDETFLARSLGRFLGRIPSAPDRYAQHYHDTRLKKFPPTPWEDFTEAVKSTPLRHELDHDIESVFWLMLYWAITAQPKGGAAEHIAVIAWLGLTGKFAERQSLLVSSLRCRLIIEGTFHSTFLALHDLFGQLA
ncbi:hypothetical protein FS837_007910 [Tulasnella sp. UAMH 9824]|nr:hypothetical protein FS837_007910 [Tulasnella sp. UAMH 9824]